MTQKEMFDTLLDRVLLTVSPDAWRQPDCATANVQLKIPAAVQEEIAKVASVWQVNQDKLETKIFSALVLDGIWANLRKQADDQKLDGSIQ